MRPVPRRAPRRAPRPRAAAAAAAEPPPPPPARSRVKITETDRAVLALKTQRRRLEDQRARLLAQADREAHVARALAAAGRRERALLALKRRRLHAAQAATLDEWLLNVESLLISVEAGADQVRLVRAVERGAAALKALAKEAPLEEVERLMEDSAAAAEYQRELQAALAAPGAAEADAEADEELAALEAAIAAAAAAGGAAAAASALPAAPTHAPNVTAAAARAREPERLAAS